MFCLRGFVASLNVAEDYENSSTYMERESSETNINKLLNATEG
nr:MAG TPA: hypothetical protein [Caudoviricetes sp.]